MLRKKHFLSKLIHFWRKSHCPSWRLPSRNRWRYWFEPFDMKIIIILEINFDLFCFVQSCSGTEAPINREIPYASNSADNNPIEQRTWLIVDRWALSIKRWAVLLFESFPISHFLMSESWTILFFDIRNLSRSRKIRRPLFIAKCLYLGIYLCYLIVSDIVICRKVTRWLLLLFRFDFLHRAEHNSVACDVSRFGDI
jgi:hypothetical protein